MRWLDGSLRARTHWGGGFIVRLAWNLLQQLLRWASCGTTTAATTQASQKLPLRHTTLASCCLRYLVARRHARASQQEGATDLEFGVDLQRTSEAAHRAEAVGFFYAAATLLRTPERLAVCWPGICSEDLLGELAAEYLARCANLSFHSAELVAQGSACGMGSLRCGGLVLADSSCRPATESTAPATTPVTGDLFPRAHFATQLVSLCSY